MYEDVCANTILTNKHYEEMEEDIKAVENFFDEIEPILCDISLKIEQIKDIEKLYEGYDLTEYYKELIGELL